MGVDNIIFIPIVSSELTNKLPNEVKCLSLLKPLVLCIGMLPGRLTDVRHIHMKKKYNTVPLIKHMEA